MVPRRTTLGVLASLLAALLPGPGTATIHPPDAAERLRARHAALASSLLASEIQQGLHVESSQDAVAPQGDVYAVIPYSYATASGMFRDPAQICDSLLLHINVQYCRASSQGRIVSVGLGKKTLQSLEDTHPLDLDYDLASVAEEYLRIEMSAEEGPLDTRDVLIAVELVALDEGRSFMHLRYSYRQGFMARLATSVYFQTNGRDKIGFTRVPGRSASPKYVRGIRGVLERNTVRYFLAFDAYLHVLGEPVERRFEARLQRWFDGTERFARQLRELGREEYLEIKREQYRRQSAETQS